MQLVGWFRLSCFCRLVVGLGGHCDLEGGGDPSRLAVTVTSSAARPSGCTLPQSANQFVSVAATVTNDRTCTACGAGLSRAMTLGTNVSVINYCNWCKEGLGKTSASSDGTASHITCQSCSATVGDTSPEYNNAIDGSACGVATPCAAGEGYHVLSTLLENTAT
eukprot:COSAG01_NODE_6305_length_3745_cov_11.371092_3_plen_164_part_00